jgi:hypothetical protein
LAKSVKPAEKPMVRFCFWREICEFFLENK